MGWFFIPFHRYHEGPHRPFFKLFSTVGQSPCDVAAELASVCVGGRAFARSICAFCRLKKL